MIALTTALSISATMVVDANAASGGAWSTLYKPSTPGAYFSSISGSDAHNAWAVGSTYYLDGKVRPPVLAHWDGARWAASPAPQVAPRATLESLSQVKAASKDSTWAIGSAMITSSKAYAGVIAHRTGGRWTTRVLPGNSFVSHVSVFSTNNVWVLGALTDANNRPVRPTYWHWNGKTWTSGALGAVPSGGSDDTYYALATVKDTSRSDGLSRGALLRYSGGRWVVDNGPRITPPKGTGGIPDTYDFVGLVRHSADSVDVSVEYRESDDPQGVVDLYHWNGTSWRRSIRVGTGSPEALNVAGQLTGDGAGGVWMTSVAPPKLGLLDIRNGKIVATATYPGKDEFVILDLTLRPGTRRVWMAGGLNTGQPKRDLAKIEGYVP